MATATLVVKTALVLATAVCLHMNATPPRPIDSSKARQYDKEDKSERAFVGVAKFLKIFAWSATAVELFLSWTSPNGASITAWTILGAVLTLWGTVLRQYCFRLLGDRFTFELATHSGSTRTPSTDVGAPGSATPALGLVTTGPYAWVRHPSYLGGCVALYGACAVFMAPGSALTVSAHIPPLLVHSAQMATLSLALSTLASVPRRIQKEEEMLQSEFGAQWQSYVRTVPWAVVPGLY
ncbi:hypothetical protein EXIGLDRAFT_427400 [Exidia glandulosa HHB12029]|uniref:Protein-S-isoprenylcysteine O-methyltransferase n=1 Tax=Exidia glandulosa HHB12029 TaxID=1314781 RepID=A0A165KI48_EXIGL|nr:hypothetical protein EXIGLDRAFT_427400 [Exidia glandulosa HHB12029]